MDFRKRTVVGNISSYQIISLLFTKLITKLILYVDGNRYIVFVTFILQVFFRGTNIYFIMLIKVRYSDEDGEITCWTISTILGGKKMSGNISHTNMN